MTRALLQQALDALETHVPHYLKDRGYPPIIAIREYLAQPEKEPICPMCAAEIDESAGVDLVGLKQQLAACERDLNEERKARKCADKAVNDYRDLYLASQLREQQLREALENLKEAEKNNEWIMSNYYVREALKALTTHNDTYALGHLKAGYNLKIK